MGGAPAHGEGGVEDVVEVDGEQAQEALAARRRHRVAGVVHVRPCIGARCQATVGKQVQDALGEGVGHHHIAPLLHHEVPLPVPSQLWAGPACLIRELLAAHEHQVLQRVREPIVVVGLRRWGGAGGGGGGQSHVSPPLAL